jgi:hypothetical protein
MSYGKRDLARIENGLCLHCEMPVVRRRRCTQCAATLAAEARVRYKAACDRKRRMRAGLIRAQKRLLERKQLSYVTLKRRERTGR